MADLRFLLAVTRTNWSGGSNYFHIKAHVVYIGESSGRNPGEVLNPQFDNYGTAYERSVGDFDSLVVSAQRDAMESEHFLPWYGFGVEFDKFGGVKLKRAESMVKVLRKIERKLDKLQEDFGYPADFSTYLIRVANALGMTGHCYGIRTDEMRPDGTNYRWMNANTLAEWFTRDEWKLEAKPSRY